MAAWREKRERVPAPALVGIRNGLLLVAPFWLLVAVALWRFA